MDRVITCQNDSYHIFFGVLLSGQSSVWGHLDPRVFCTSRGLERMLMWQLALMMMEGVAAVDPVDRSVPERIEIVRMLNDRR